MPTFTKEERVEQLKACAKGIIREAEDIIGSAEYSVDWLITIEMKCKEFPTIKVERHLNPKELIDVICKK